MLFINMPYIIWRCQDILEVEIEVILYMFRIYNIHNSIYEKNISHGTCIDEGRRQDFQVLKLLKSTQELLHAL